MTDLHSALEAAIRARLDVARKAATIWPEKAANWRAEPTDIKGVYRVIDGETCWVTGDIPDEAVADHIALHDPADAIRRYERDLKVLERHGIIWRDIGWLERDGDEIDEAFAELPVCERCVRKHASFRTRAEVPEGACADVLDLLDVYPEVTR